MASILNEYVTKGLGLIDLQNELENLIKKYNKQTGRYLFVYAADFNKGRVRGVDISLGQEDFYNIQDILRDTDKEIIDIYIETPGGSGEAAEEIAKYLRKKFKEVNFVIAGEAKSAGTILALSGDNIYMTDTGSLGPIDAQVKIGRSVVSAHDYKEWVENKRKEAEEKGSLNPFDAIMVAQISPGELGGIINSLEFAKDLVSEWLEKYKFKNWKKTEGKQEIVTDKKRKERAKEVANYLANHTEWRSHGRSLKIEDFDGLLQIERIDDDPKFADIVYRIKTVIRLIFDTSTIYKLYNLDNFRLGKTFTVNPGMPQEINIPKQNLPKQQKQIEGIDVDIQCPKCKKLHKIKGYLNVSSEIIKKAKLPFTKNIDDKDIFTCDNCNFNIDLKPIKASIEHQTKKRVIFK
jgi:hypothetical protein